MVFFGHHGHLISPYEVVGFNCSENFDVVFVSLTAKLRNLAMLLFCAVSIPTQYTLFIYFIEIISISK